MTTRLLLYNKALRYCGEARLASLTEAREPRYLLDDVWDEGGVRTCLERGQWTFAMATVLLDYDTAVTPPFGYRRAFSKPSDWVVTSGLCSDEYFSSPLTRYSDEAGYWYADLDQIYVRYVSDDAAYGGDLSRWSPNFANFVAAYFASEIVLKLTSDVDKQKEMFALLKKNLSEARNVDAMAGPPKFMPAGTWASSRQSGTSRRDGGNRNNLIG